MWGPASLTRPALPRNPLAQDGRVMVEEDLLDALHISLTRPLEEVLTTLRKVLPASCGWAVGS